MASDIRQQLRVKNRSFRKYPGKLMLGPTGARLWADQLESAPGFMGRIDFIHKLNLPLLFTVRVSGQDARLMPADYTWYPDEGVMEYSRGGIAFRERKTVSWQDEALSLQTWTNTTEEPLNLEAVLPEGARENELYRFPVNLHGLKVVMKLRFGSAIKGGKCVLAPGETKSFLIAAALCLEEESALLDEKLDRIMRREGDADALMDEKCAEYLSWFDSAPQFECSDPYIERCWLYRLYILRSCLAKPGIGYLKHALFYEGRAHAMVKTPYQASGWEFSRLIPLSTPLTMTDMRWLRQPEVSKEAFRALTDSVNQDGAFSVSAVDDNGKEYTNYAAWALYLYYTLWGDKAFIAEVLPAFKKDALSVYARHKGANDDLMVCYTHALTGKEYQPGYWFFTNQCFPPKVRGTQEGYTPLKRVDSSIYMYLNCLALSRLCRETGDPDADMFENKAKAIRRDVLKKMWEGVSGCFYDLHHQNDKRAYVKHIVNIYPLWAEITSEEHLKALDYLFSPDYFARGSGFASAAADCPVYSPSGGWKGDYFKGRDGCMWNGPSWPYTTCIALDAAAKQSKLHGHSYDRQFMKYFGEYTLEHFRGGKLDDPYLVEFYNAETGEALSDEPDYNHSFYLDLVVRHIAGIEPTEKGFCFHPVKTDMHYFSLKAIQIKGHLIDVTYDAKSGYRLCIDGQERLRVDDTDEYFQNPKTFELDER